VGVVNYLIKQKTVDEIINHTQIPFGLLILSGPIPPNPSRDDLSEVWGVNLGMKKYDYIILTHLLLV
jgi:hypothetical protein